ncbi:MAG: ParB N-terminal domain-containing protein [Tabrizicola sp.]|uniref:ParB/RepB/Spo0J family partition protein n=1 Tax=Tabrizicola sp. TaxID=2005166 RepID=UPI002733B1A8|nr:ParB N-terminal domain-containing protein [Tabrizicola sp.]MDP3262583.1 ParB N-terminal domain-containing protein [Tabrizicola sp.]MDP3647743.1 ParB N-terminal domain-containing protein [Paracoccaceae bacterium]MDZ4068890.1 ParB N-terminal domain-containing protein [Tabrizicola sp.]
MDPLIQIPLTEIDPHALLRDRTTLDPTSLTELQTSILLDGLRTPIEVWRLTTPRPQTDGPPHLYGLISGLRRLTAARALGLGLIPAFLRTPASLPAAMAAMVTENEIRAPVTPWEKGALIIASVEEGHFPTPDAAVAALYPALARQARMRLRAFAMVVEALTGLLTTPERLSTRAMERLAAALRGDMEDLIRATLTPLAGHALDLQWSSLLPILGEKPDPEALPGRPRKLLHLRQGLTIRREACREGWVLRFTGPEARRGGFVDDVLDEIERWFQQS